jgi:hypothetical protein
MKYLITLVLLLTYYAATGQTDDAKVPLNYKGPTDAQLHIYNPPFDAIATITSRNQATYANPEEVILSEHAANTQEWLNDLFFEKDSINAKESPEYFRNKNELNKQENYFRLLHKLSFEFNGYPTAIIKSRLYIDNKPTVLTYGVYQQHNGRWYKYPTGELQEMKMMVMQLKSDVLLQLLRGETGSNKLINEVIQETRTENNSIDFIKTYNLLLQWSENSRASEVERLKDPFMMN